MSNENTKTSMVFYESAYAAINYLPTVELKWEATQGLLNYGFYGIEPESDNPFVNMIYVQAIPSMRNAKERYDKAVNNGKKGGRPTEISTEEIMQMKQEGMTNKQIAAKLGCSVSNIENRVTTYKKTHPNNPNNLSVSVSDSVSSSVSDSVSASASAHEEEDKREIEDLEEKELEPIKRDYKGHMSYNDIKQKYNLKAITREQLESIDALLRAKQQERQKAERAKDDALYAEHKSIIDYIGGTSKTTLDRCLAYVGLDINTFTDFADKHKEYSFDSYNAKKNDFGYHQDCNGKMVCNMSYGDYLQQGINASCA